MYGYGIVGKGVLNNLYSIDKLYLCLEVTSYGDMFDITDSTTRIHCSQPSYIKGSSL